MYSSTVYALRGVSGCLISRKKCYVTLQYPPLMAYVIKSKCTIYYIKLQKSLSVCLPVCLYPPFFSTRPSDRNQIWHTYSGRYGTHSQLNFFDPAHPRGNITSYVTSSNVEYVMHLKTTARRSMTLHYVMLAVRLAT